MQAGIASLAQPGFQNLAPDQGLLRRIPNQARYFTVAGGDRWKIDQLGWAVVPRLKGDHGCGATQIDGQRSASLC